MKRAITSAVLLLSSAFVLVGCERDDGPAIRKAIAECQLSYIDQTGDNILLYYLQSNNHMRTCMQSMGFSFDSSKSVCAYNIGMDIMDIKAQSSEDDKSKTDVCYRRDK